MLPPRAKYIVSPDARRKQLVIPGDATDPINESKYASGHHSAEFDPIAMIKNRTPLDVKQLPLGTTADKTVTPVGAETLPRGTTADKGEFILIFIEIVFHYVLI